MHRLKGKGDKSLISELGDNDSNLADLEFKAAVRSSQMLGLSSKSAKTTNSANIQSV